MATNYCDGKFFESMRGQIVTLLGRSGRTVEELARVLGFTDNGVPAAFQSSKTPPVRFRALIDGVGAERLELARA